MLIYDITDPASLTCLKALSSTIHKALRRPQPSTPPPKTRSNGGFPVPASPATATRPYHFLLLGAKNDVSPSRREVSWLEGHNAAREFFGPWGVAGGASAGFLEVSAQTGENVGAVFLLLGREVLRSRREGKRDGYRARRCGPGGGAWECSSFDLEAEVEGSAADLDGDFDYADGRGSLTGGVRRRWMAFKAMVTRGLGRE